MPTNPRMYRPNHPFPSKYTSKSTNSEPTASQMCQKLGCSRAAFITPLGTPPARPMPSTLVQRTIRRNIRRKAATKIQRKWRSR